MAMRRRKRQLRRQCGQALVLVALAMPLFMSVAALVVDGTNLMVHRRQLQTAADGAALAAAQDLSGYLAAGTANPGSASCSTWGTPDPLRQDLVAAIQDIS